MSSSKMSLRKSNTKASPQAPAQDVNSVLIALKRLATKRTLDGMARYVIPCDNAFGVSVGDMRKLAKRTGKDHALAEALWKTGWYEARMMATFVDDPALVTPAQMDRWCRDFDSWAICDTACFCLFDRTPHAFGRIVPWSRRRGEFSKRAAFALLASLALHDKHGGDEPFARFLPLIERGADDDRNFVKKGVSWALRAVGERSPGLHAASVAMAQRLADSAQPASRWIGKDVLRQLASRPSASRLKTRRRGSA